MCQHLLLLLALVASLNSVQAQQTAASTQVKSIGFCLAGDSTTASNAGWGDNFCQQTLQPGVSCANFGHSGATTSSFIADTSNLSWNSTLNCVKNGKGTSNVFVTIQFGHNDQKLGDSFKPTYYGNLKRMATDVISAGGYPILVTPLSRRNYFGNGTIDDILEPWAVYVRKAAADTNQPYIELLQTSIKYLNRIGEKAAWRLNYDGTDHTHLNNDGKIIFGRMVADLIKAKGVVSPDPFKVNATLSAQEAAGIATF